MTTLDTIITCPYEATHRIRKNILQYHLVRCKKNYSNATKVQCPFDACHIIDEAYYKNHVNNCASSGNVKSYKYNFKPEQELGTVSLETTKMLSVPVMQDWSKEYVPTYDPWKNTEAKDIIRYLIGGSKSQKKRFKLTERKRIQVLEHKDIINSNRKIQSQHIKLKKYTNISNIISKMRRLNLEHFDTLLESIDFSKLCINDVANTSTKKHVSDLLERVIMQKLKDLRIHHIK